MLIVFDLLALRFTSHRDQSIVRLHPQHPGGTLFDVKNRGPPKVRKKWDEAI